MLKHRRRFPNWNAQSNYTRECTRSEARGRLFPTPHRSLALSGDRERAADRRRRTLSGYDRSELRLEGIDLARQLDGAEQLGSLADDAAHLAGFVRGKPAFCDARKEIAEYLGTILCRFQRPQRKMDRCSSAGGIALSIKRRAALTSPSLVAASNRASNSASMFWTTLRLKRSLACFVNVMVSG